MVHLYKSECSVAVIIMHWWFTFLHVILVHVYMYYSIDFATCMYIMDLSGQNGNGLCCWGMLVHKHLFLLLIYMCIPHLYLISSYHSSFYYRNCRSCRLTISAVNDGHFGIYHCTVSTSAHEQVTSKKVKLLPRKGEGSLVFHMYMNRYYFLLFSYSDWSESKA